MIDYENPLRHSYRLRIQLESPSQQLIEGSALIDPGIILNSSMPHEHVLQHCSRAILSQISARVTELGGFDGPLIIPPEE